MDSESANFYVSLMQYQTLYLQIVSKWMLTGKRPNQRLCSYIKTTGMQFTIQKYTKMGFFEYVISTDFVVPHNTFQSLINQFIVVHSFF